MAKGGVDEALIMTYDRNLVLALILLNQFEHFLAIRFRNGLAPVSNAADRLTAYSWWAIAQVTRRGHHNFLRSLFGNPVKL
jgi:hypothetical protein